MAAYYAWTWHDFVHSKWCFKMRCPKTQWLSRCLEFWAALKALKWMAQGKWCAKATKPPNVHSLHHQWQLCQRSDLTHTESIRPTLCNHSLDAGTWVLFEFAPLVFFNLISPVYHPKPNIHNLALIDLILFMAMLYWALVFYNSFPALKGARISKDTLKDVFQNQKKGNWSC